MFEKAGAPAAWYNAVGEQKARKVQQLAQVVFEAEVVKGEFQNPLGVLALGVLLGASALLALRRRQVDL